MRMVTVEAVGFREASGRFIAAGPVTRGALGIEINAYAKKVVSALKAEAPAGRTGELRKGIGYRLATLPTGFEARFYSSAYYTKWVIEGRGWVYPKTAKCLHWITKDGKEVFAMKARPTKPNDFPARVMGRMTGQGSLALRQVAARVIPTLRGAGAIGRGIAGVTGFFTGMLNRGMGMLGSGI